MKLILASASPRRAELLKLITSNFAVIPSDADEEIKEKLAPAELVMALARIKAESVFENNADGVVIGSDTVVAAPNGEILGKPKNKADARRMMKLLSGCAHSVFTGVCLVKQGKQESFYCETKVYFYKLTEDEIEEYISTSEPYDKAGGYGIQGKAGLFCEKIEGDYLNIVGLPASMLYKKLKAF